MQDLPGLGRHQQVIVLLFGPRAGVDGLGIAPAQVDPAAALGIYPGGQADLDPRALLAVFVCAQPAQVGRVGQHAPRLFAKALPLRGEVVAHVVADALDHPAVGVRELGDVRRVDDHLTLVGHHRLELVHALGRHPDVFVHPGHDRQHAAHRPVEAAHVDSRGQVGGLRPGLLGRAREHPGQAFVRHHVADGQFFCFYHGRGPVDGLAHGRVLGADNATAGDQGAQPVGEIYELLAADAGEEVLVAAREARHLVGEDRAADGGTVGTVTVIKMFLTCFRSLQI